MQLLPAVTKPEGAQGCAQDLLEALPPVMHFLRNHMRGHMRGRRRALSMPQFRTLALLAATPASNLSAVADFLDASLPTASRIVTGLVAKGFVTRHECPSDRRQVELSLTTKGHAAMESARATARQKLVEELSAMDPAQLRVVSRAMSVLSSVFGPKLRDAARGEGAYPGGAAAAARTEAK